MILTALRDLAEAEGLIRERDFEFRDVSWIIELGRDGSVAGVTDVRVPDARGVPRAQPKLVPKSGQRSGKNPTPWFLCDNSGFVLGLELTKDGLAKPMPSRLEAFLALVGEAEVATRDPGLQAVANFLRHQDPQRGKPPWVPGDLKKGDWIALRLVGDDGLVSNRPDVEAWWRGRRLETGERTAQCLVTGEPCIPVEKHDPIKGILPGPGTALVTFNDSAFESYGLNRNENAPVGRAAAEAYVRALNRLLDPAYPDPRDASRTLRPRRIRLGSDSVAVFWADQGGEAFADLFEELFNRPDLEVVGRMLESPRSGRAPAAPVSPRFFSLTLSAAQGRAAIRDWFVGAVDEVQARVSNHFQDLELLFPFENPPAPSINALLRSVVLGGDTKNLHPNVVGEAFRAILHDRPLPATLLAAAVRRIRAEGPLARGAKGRPDWNRSHLRMQLLKAALERLRRASRPELTEVKVMLDEENAQSAYRLGRLFAVLERLQGLAQGNVNATIADRFYGSASTMPGVAFPQLLRLSKHHLAKLRRERRGAAVNLEKLIGSICEGFPAQRFPAVLAMEDQGLFAIGYYHQRQALFPKRDDAPEPAGHPTAA